MEEILTIVIADDCKYLSYMLKDTIERDKRYKVLGVAHDDATEIELIETLKPDVVITDLLRGTELTGLDIIREYKSKKKSPIFFVVSGGIFYTIDRLRELQIEFYLSKPYTDEELMSKLSTIYIIKKVYE